MIWRILLTNIIKGVCLSSAEKMHKYDVLANKLGQEYGCRTRNIPYVMTWDGVVTKYHRRHSKDIGITDFI
ncbi:hypothetical protein PAEPH01_0804 [Pancytospora epiphaga]|nr:hypothetical protein PAEPH01_0804 [Pancytospora epiphaga]